MLCKLQRTGLISSSYNCYTVQLSKNQNNKINPIFLWCQWNMCSTSVHCQKITISCFLTALVACALVRRAKPSYLCQQPQGCLLDQELWGRGWQEGGDVFLGGGKDRKVGGTGGSLFHQTLSPCCTQMLDIGLLKSVP